jgi:hypothetical protein
VEGKPAPPRKKEVVLPREVSLFPIDRFGEVDAASSKPKPPEGFGLVHF